MSVLKNVFEKIVEALFQIVGEKPIIIPKYLRIRNMWKI